MLNILKNKLLIITLVVTFLVVNLSSCSNTTVDNQTKTDASKEVEEEEFAEREIVKEIDKTRQVNFVNWKPETESYWKELVKIYTEETGVVVNVETISDGVYFDELNKKLKSNNPPTLFEINSYKDLEKIKQYCYDLKNTEVHKNLFNDNFSLKSGDEIIAIPYDLECYGIIVNKNLLKQAGYSTKDINSFDDLQNVAEDISSRQEQLGFTAFTSAGLEKNSAWRFNTHLMNMPIYFEYTDKNIVTTNKISGTYLDNFKILWDLYINNSTTDPDDLEKKTVDDARLEFINGEAVFYQNGSWDYNKLIDGGLLDTDLDIIPIYIGVGDEKKQGLCTGTENYWVVNKNAKQNDLDATLDFMKWCVTNPTALDSFANDMGLSIPYKNAQVGENIFFKLDREIFDSGKIPVHWYFNTIPNEDWKEQIRVSLVKYSITQVPNDFEQFKKVFVDNWEKGYK